MRRPLFGNGIPKNILNADGAVLVLDSNGLDKNTVYAVTLFAWAWGNNPAPVLATEPQLLAGVVSNGQPVVAVAAYTAAFFNNWKTAREKWGQPIKVLDRYLMRGNQQLFVSNTTALSENCWVFGFFEAVGEVPTAEPFRPLQPAALVAPFTPDPVVVFPVGPNASEYKIAHRLDAAYLDAVTLRVLTATAGLVPYTAVPTAHVRLPGGKKMPLPMPPATTLDAIDCAPFDGIPMLAPSAADNLIEIGFDSNGDVASAAALSGFGQFRRY